MANILIYPGPTIPIALTTQKIETEVCLCLLLYYNLGHTVHSHIRKKIDYLKIIIE